MEYLFILLMFLLFALNVPIAFGIAIAALGYFMAASDLPTEAFVQRIVSITGSFPLLAVPFFILVGTIMNYAGITRRLFVLADALVGHMVGGLAQVNVLLSTLMGGLSASANADAAMQAKMLAPEMIRRGFSPGFTAAVTACSAVITPIIPPGIGLIIYGYLADVSVGRLFLGGIVPGLLLCAAQMGTVHVISQRRGYVAARGRPATLRELAHAFLEALGALSIALFIIVGIRFGIFTPTEAGAMVVVYAVLLGLFVHRELKLAHFPAIILETVLATGAVMLIIGAASAFGYYLTWERIPAALADLIVSLTDSPILLLLLLNLLLLGIGMLIEGTAALILLTPILVPVIKDLGIDPVQFGVVMIVNLTIGGVTPPVGTLMFTTCSIMRIPLEVFTREALPFIAAMLLVLLAITLIPELVTFVPDLMMG